MEGIGEFLYTLIQELLCNLVVMNTNFLEGGKFCPGLWYIVLDGEADYTMIAEGFDGLKWHGVHGIGADQLLGVQHIAISGVFRACAGP